MKILVYGVLALVIIGGGYMLLGSNPTSEEANMETSERMMADASPAVEGAVVVPTGSYTVVPAESTFNWSGKKPLVDGYINSGTIALSEGDIMVTDASATGSFTLDMDTLDVGLTAKKPGQEGALEGHLKGEGWFNVAEYPTATFEIKEVIPHSESDVTFTYQVRGDLTMKGQTHEVTIPATIYFKDGKLVAKADTEIDRTQWGITAGSGNFVENLGDNVISDMVAISFTLVATPTE